MTDPTPLLPHGDAVEAAKVRHAEAICFLVAATDDNTTENGERVNAALMTQMQAEEALILAATAHGRARAYTDIAQQLEAGTLHVLTCNADHSKPIGGSGCSCPLGRILKKLKAQLAEQDAEIQRTRSATLALVEKEARRRADDAAVDKLAGWIAESQALNLLADFCRTQREGA